MGVCKAYILTGVFRVERLERVDMGTESKTHGTALPAGIWQCEDGPQALKCPPEFLQSHHSQHGLEQCHRYAAVIDCLQCPCQQKTPQALQVAEAEFADGVGF